MSRMLNRKSAMIELANGTEIEWETDSNGWIPSNDVVNPITYPDKMWRVKVEPWEEAYSIYIEETDYQDDVQLEEAYKAGWDASRDFHKSKKP